MRKTDNIPQPIAATNNQIFVRVKPPIHFVCIKIEINKNKKT